MSDNLAKRIEERVANGDGLFKQDYCEFDEFSSLLFQDVRIYMFLDQQLDSGISARQIRLLQEFLSLNEDSLPAVKTALFEHWDDGSDYWDSDVEFDNADDAFAHSKVSGLFIMPKDHGWGASACQIRFTVPWDSEHGAGVFIRDGQVAGFGDL